MQGRQSTYGLSMCVCVVVLLCPKKRGLCRSKRVCLPEWKAPAPRVACSISVVSAEAGEQGAGMGLGMGSHTHAALVHGAICRPVTLNADIISRYYCCRVLLCVGKGKEALMQVRTLLMYVTLLHAFSSSALPFKQESLGICRCKAEPCRSISMRSIGGRMESKYVLTYLCFGLFRCLCRGNRENLCVWAGVQKASAISRNRTWQPDMRALSNQEMAAKYNEREKVRKDWQWGEKGGGRIDDVVALFRF
ncbi:hypothetical protein GQ54DRAFT_205599 [Martensiomyces pterosporus]|nr:hypothetical protein GQ54DRAFT_205599 [Martensiomyces pterosporus]